MPRTKTQPPARAPRAARSDRGVQRASSAFYIMRALCIRELAARGETTEDIAKRFGVNRSFIIKQATIVLKPRTPKEAAILKVARSLATGISFTFEDMLTGADIKTTLAGAARPPKSAKAPAKAKKAAKPKVKPAKARKPRLTRATPQPSLTEDNG